MHLVEIEVQKVVRPVALVLPGKVVCPEVQKVARLEVLVLQRMVEEQVVCMDTRKEDQGFLGRSY